MLPVTPIIISQGRRHTAMDPPGAEAAVSAGCTAESSRLHNSKDDDAKNHHGSNSKSLLSSLSSATPLVPAEIVMGEDAKSDENPSTLSSSSFDSTPVLSPSAVVLTEKEKPTQTSTGNNYPVAACEPCLKKQIGSSSVPLSRATTDAHSNNNVHNDTLKVIVVSSSSADKSWLSWRLKRGNKNDDNEAPPAMHTRQMAVDVHKWGPNNNLMSDEADEPSSAAVKCVVWNVQGPSVESCADFGAHPAFQSLFFSPNSLYLLIWDLAATNQQVNHHCVNDFDLQDDFWFEEANRQADQALREDIMYNVFSWFDCIAQKGPKTAVLPVALIPEHLPDEEVQHRCKIFSSMLHSKYGTDALSPQLLTGTDKSILCLNRFGGADGIERLQEMVMAIANDPLQFDHVGSPVPHGAVLVRDTIQKFKKKNRLILLDHLLEELGGTLDTNSVTVCLHFLASIGEILYFGTGNDDVLSSGIILSQNWLLAALSCILRNDLQGELQYLRQLTNIQCMHGDQKYEEHEITKALMSGRASSCPLLSTVDTSMIWQSTPFMREASDRYAKLAERFSTTPTMFYFLEQLLVHSGMFLPLGPSRRNAASETEVFFVPSLLVQEDPYNSWTYRSSQSFLTTLCHSWLFRDGTPSNLFEQITLQVLHDLYEFSHSCESSAQVDSVLAERASFQESMQGHKEDAMDCVRIRIHHVVCFKSSLMVKIGSVFPDARTGELRESFVEVFITLVDQSSPHFVARNPMCPSMQRVVVCGKGRSGNQGQKLWKGGYRIILESVRETLSNMGDVQAQAICLVCLACSSPRVASPWSWDSVLVAAESGHPQVICQRGHQVDSHLICGTCPDQKLRHRPDVEITHMNEILQSVVLVGVWDSERRRWISLGSGFFVDKKAGLVVTAAHVLFDMEGNSSSFGKSHLNENTQVVIGVISERAGTHAVFRYIADIVASDVRNVDACVLQIRSRLEKDVHQDFDEIEQPRKRIYIEDMPAEELSQLKMTKHFQLEEFVRVAGYNQGGEGIYEVGRHISCSIDLAGGHICRHFQATTFDDSYLSSLTKQRLVPEEEIVLECLTMFGHSGGPCINNDGEVVGILSRSDERDRCFLTPVTQIIPLVKQAKHHFTWC